ncbi:hypothetical protein NT017_20550 [Prolixibacter sp. NT017]|nr:hypothetical protein NT017_20550 [Prolixibacter sp. NT017]
MVVVGKAVLMTPSVVDVPFDETEDKQKKGKNSENNNSLKGNGKMPENQP